MRWNVKEKKDLRIFDTEIGVCTNFMTENWSQIGNSRIDKLSNKGKNSWVIELVVVIGILALRLSKEQAQSQN